MLNIVDAALNLLFDWLCELVARLCEFLSLLLWSSQKGNTEVAPPPPPGSGTPSENVGN